MTRIALPDWLSEFGGEDRVFDWLIVAAPLLLFVIAFLGRTLVTKGLAGGYITVFLGYIVYRGVRGENE